MPIPHFLVYNILESRQKSKSKIAENARNYWVQIRLLHILVKSTAKLTIFKAVEAKIDAAKKEAAKAKREELEADVAEFRKAS